MRTISYSEARNNLAEIMDSAVRDREPITIARIGAGRVVLMAAEEYSAMEATLHLFSTSANAEQIHQNLADYSAGKVHPGGLCD
jgi:antitoxin YefM